MADKRIYELNATNTAQSGDFFVIDSEGEGTRKITKSNLLGGIEEDVQALETKVGTVALTTTAQDCSGAINELKDTTDDTTNMMSDAYDNTATYVVGDIVIYDGALYKCNTDISTAEDFDSTKWDATTIDAELSKVGTGAIDTGDTNLTSAVNSLNSRMEIGGVDYKFAIDSIVNNVTVADGTTYNTYSSRKFSDYAVLIMIPGSSNINSRNCVIANSGRFCQTGGQMIATVLHDAGISSKSAIGITYVSDTSYKVTLDGAKIIKNLTVLGLLKKS